MLKTLDVILHVLHFAVILANLTFWMFRRTLRVAQVVQGLTVLSWFGLGFVYGFGYCFLTDWQWQVKEALGENNLPSSYIKYVADKLSGSDWDAGLIDQLTLAFFGASVLGCLMQTLRKRSKG